MLATSGSEVKDIENALSRFNCTASEKIQRGIAQHAELELAAEKNAEKRAMDAKERVARIGKLLKDPDCPVSIAAGSDHTVGLCADGTVVVCGYNGNGLCDDVANWRNVVSIATESDYTVGLCENGKVVACGGNNKGQHDVGAWRNVVAIAAGSCHTVGLCADGSVVACGSSIGGKCNVGGWKLFQSEADLEAAIEQRRIAAEKAAEERRIAEERAAEERRIAEEEARLAKIAELEKEKANLQAELPNIKGLFASSKKKDMESRIAAIDAELAKLNK